MAATQPLRIPTVYESTATGMPPLRPYFGELWGRRRFVWHLARSDLKAEHYDSAIGQLWVMLDPLLLAAVYFLLRTVVKPINSGPSRNAIIAHLVWAVFVFTFVSNSMMAGARSLLNGRGLILNASFPRAVLPITAIIKSLFDFLPTLFVYFVFHLVLGQPFGLSLITLPVIVVILTVMSLGLGLLFAPLMVFYRDTGGFLPYVTKIWLYVTPALYFVREIPPNLLVYLRWNPLYPSFAALEQIFNAQFPSAGVPARGVGVGDRVLLVRSRGVPGAERDFAVRL